MKPTICGLALLALMIGSAIPARAADAIKGGNWEFTSQLQGLAGAAAPSGGVVGSTQMLCINAERAVPTDPRQGCTIDRTQRNGGTVSWTGTCTTPQGKVRSEGVAQYSGDTMQATLTTHIPQPNGNTLDTSQRITGRYRGACAAR